MVETRLSRWLSLALITALLISAAASDVAFGQPTCELVPQTVQLGQRVGAPFGTPVGCARVDSDGNLLQTTTTGLAIVRPDGMAVFAAGDQHWALSDQGLESWTGNWHNGLYPPATPAADVQTEPSRSPVGQVETMTLVGVDRDQATAVMRAEPDGSTVLIQTADGCPDLSSAIGEHVFLRSDGTSSDLVLLRQHQTCAVASMRPANND